MSEPGNNSVALSRDDLIAAAGKVDAQNDAMKARLDRYISDAQGLVEQGWKGTASAAFTATVLRWNDDSKKLHEALVAIAEQMRSAANTLGTQDEDAAHLLGGLG